MSIGNKNITPMPTFFNRMSLNQDNEMNEETKERLDKQDELIKNLNEKVENLLNSYNELID